MRHPVPRRGTNPPAGRPQPGGAAQPLRLLRLHRRLCPRRDWRVFGPDSFTFEVLETLERGPGQTDAAFRADLETLRDIWRDKLTAEGAALYH